MSTDPRPYLHDILDRIERIERYTAQGRQAFLDTDWQQDAVIRCFEVIGEAIKRLDNSLLEQHTQVSWRGFAGFRDMLIHQYDKVVMEWVWQFSQEDLPALKAAVTAMLQDLNEGWRMEEANPFHTLEDIRRLRPQIMELAGKFRARQVSVFGSIVRGEMHADSDIDFLVDFEEEYSLLDHAGLLVGLEDLLGCKVDVVPRRALRPFLREAVISEAQDL